MRRSFILVTCFSLLLMQPAHSFTGFLYNMYSSAKNYYFGVDSGSEEQACFVVDPSPVPKDKMSALLDIFKGGENRGPKTDRELRACIDESKKGDAAALVSARKVDFDKACVCHRDNTDPYLAKNGRSAEALGYINEYKRNIYQGQLIGKFLESRDEVSKGLYYANNFGFKLPPKCEGIEEKAKNLSCSNRERQDQVNEQIKTIIEGIREKSSTFEADLKAVAKNRSLSEAERNVKRNEILSKYTQQLPPSLVKYLKENADLSPRDFINMNKNHTGEVISKIRGAFSRPLDSVRLNRSTDTDRKVIEIVGQTINDYIRGLSQEDVRAMGLETFNAPESNKFIMTAVVSNITSIPEDKRAEVAAKFQENILKNVKERVKGALAVAEVSDTTFQKGAGRESIIFFSRFFENDSSYAETIAHISTLENMDDFSPDYFSKNFHDSVIALRGSPIQSVLPNIVEGLEAACETIVQNAQEICDVADKPEAYEGIIFRMDSIADFLDGKIRDDLLYTSAMCEMLANVAVQSHNVLAVGPKLPNDTNPFVYKDVYSRAFHETHSFKFGSETFNDDSIRFVAQSGIFSDAARIVQSNKNIRAVPASYRGDADPFALLCSNPSSNQNVCPGTNNREALRDIVSTGPSKTATDLDRSISAVTNNIGGNYGASDFEESREDRFIRIGEVARRAGEMFGPSEISSNHSRNPASATLPAYSSVTSSTGDKSSDSSDKTTSNDSGTTWGDVISNATNSFSPTRNQSSSIFDMPVVSATSEAKAEEIKVSPSATDSAISAELKKLRDDNEKMRAELEAQRKAIADADAKKESDGNTALEKRIKELQLELEASEKRISAAEKELKERETKKAQEKAVASAKAAEADQQSKKIFATPAYTAAPVKSKPEEYGTPAGGGGSVASAPVSSVRTSGGNLSGNRAGTNSAMGANYSNSSGLVLTSKEFESLSLNDLSQHEGKVLRVQEIARRSDGVAQLVTKQYKVVKMDGIHITMPIDENGEVISDDSKGRAPASIVTEISDDKVYTEADLRRLEREQEERARHKKLIEELEAARK